MDISRFALIDHLVAAADDLGWARYRSTVPETGPLFEAHFPGRPLLPGVLQLEMMAQAGGLLMLRRRGLTQMPILAGVDKARFRREVPPGRQLVVTAKLEQEADRLAAFNCELTDETGAVSSAFLRLALSDFPDGEARKASADGLERIGFMRSEAPEQAR